MEKEIRKISNLQNTNERTISGYAIIFNSMSENLGGFYETIEPTAIDGVIEISNVFALLNHDENKVLARSKYGVGSLKLEVDEKGLKYSFDAPNTDAGNEALEFIKRGDISTSSFAFTVENDFWVKNTDGTYNRIITKFGQLFDISPVFDAAYSATSADCKRFLEVKENDQKELEKRDVIINIVINEEEEKECDEEEEKEIETPESEETNEEVLEDAVEETEETDVNNENEIEENSCQSEKRSLNASIKNNEKRMENYGLLKAINDVVNNRSINENYMETINGARAEMRKAGLSYSGQIQLPVVENRAINEGVGLGLETIATTKANLELPLAANLTVVKAGAKMYTGLISNLSVPVYAGSTFTWESEITGASDGSGAFSQVDFAPKRITGYLPISKTLLTQDSANVEAGLLEDIMLRLSEKLESTIFGTVSGSTAPVGLFAGVATGGTAASYSALTASVATLEKANVNKYSWICSPSAKATLKSTPKTANSPVMVWDNNEVDGTPAQFSSLVPDKGYVVGDFSQLVVAQWGAIDITIDPYTMAGTNQIKLVVNAYFDVKPLRASAFVKGYFA